MSEITTAGIYCASSPRIDREYFRAADELTGILVQNNITIYFGGGKHGLMGQVATRVNLDNGKIVGVIPGFMKDENWHNEEIGEMIVVNSMHKRKETIFKHSEALIALPGGCGTIEELMEAITWKQLGLFNGPIIILNTRGYYDPLVTLLDKMVNESFLREVHRNMWSVINNPSEIMGAIKESPPWSVNARNFAAVK